MDYRWFISRRYLISRKRFSMISIITSISMVGVALGVAALIVVLSVLNGFFDFVRDLLVTADPHVRIESVEPGGLANVDSVVSVAVAQAHVTGASPFVQGKALLTSAGRTGDVNKVVIVRGVDPATAGDVIDVADQILFGRFAFDRRDGHPGIVVGLDLAERLSLMTSDVSDEGSQVSLLSAPALERALTTIWGGTTSPRFDVRGVYDRTTTTDESTVYVHIDEARRLFRMRSRASSVDLRLDDIERAGQVKSLLAAQLPEDRFRVRTWYDLQRSLYDVMRLEKWGASAILALIILVAAFNIVGSLTMVVIEKRRDVGVLQAMGVSRQNIRRIFINEGLLIGLAGTSVGLALGLGLVLLQDRFQFVPIVRAESFLIDAYPVSVQWLDILVIGVIAVGLCVLASLYPAGRAAAVEPATAVQMDG